jgi:hypothetical protein
VTSRADGRALEVLQVAVLTVSIWVGSALMWLAVPPSGLWLAGEVTSTTEGFLFCALGGIPLSMVAFGFVLVRLDMLYSRLRPGRSMLEPAMAVSVVAALILFLVWFLFLAEMTPVSGR